MVNTIWQPQRGGSVLKTKAQFDSQLLAGWFGFQELLEGEIDWESESWVLHVALVSIYSFVWSGSLLRFGPEFL